MITYNSEGITMPKIKKRETTAWIRRVAATYGKKVGEVGYLFCDDEKILEVKDLRVSFRTDSGTVKAVRGIDLHLEAK